MLSNDGDVFTAVQLMEGCHYAGAMEVQRGVDATITRGLVKDAILTDKVKDAMVIVISHG